MICRRIEVLLGCLFSISCVAKTDTSSTFTIPSQVQITITESTFVKAAFDIEGCLIENESCRINGHIPYGVVSGLPKSYVKSIAVSFQGSTYQLDVTNMYNAWGNRPLEYSVSSRYFGGRCFDERNCQFRGVFSDAAGSFAAEWVILNGYVTRTVLTSSHDVVNLFLNNIDPPEYD